MSRMRGVTGAAADLHNMLAQVLIAPYRLQMLPLAGRYCQAVGGLSDQIQQD